MEEPQDRQAPPYPRWVNAADAISLALLVLAGIVFVTGGVRTHLAGLRISVTSPGRLLLLGGMVIAVRHFAFRRVTLPHQVISSMERWPAHRIRTAQVLALAVLLLALAAGSTPTRIGDGAEYMAMARNLSRLRPPALSPAEMPSLERPFWRSNVPYYSLTSFSTAGKDGRRDFSHFWLYPLLASPFIRIASLVGVHPNYGFLAINLLCLLLASVVLLRPLGFLATLIVVTGPLPWWIDKAHTEIFAFATLVIAIAVLPLTPGVSLLVLGAATAQNPAVAPIAAAVFVWTVTQRRFRRSKAFWMGAAGGAAIAAINPLYYWLRLGTVLPLGGATIPHVPGLIEVTTFIWDPNVGLLTNHPALALALVGAAVTLLKVAPKRLLSADLWLMVVLACLLLAAFAQTINVNHGATPSISRYALWLIPLTIPLLAQAHQLTEGRRPAWLLVAAAVSIGWSCLVYPPSRIEDSYMAPTPLAAWLWTAHPGVDNPLPEIFCERVQGSGNDIDLHVLPAATKGCEKILFAGEGDRPVVWPSRCPPAAVPDECRRQNTLCYANRRGADYACVRAPLQAAFRWRTASLQ